MPQFLIDPKTIRGSTASIVGSEAKHLIRVLRYRAGDSLWVSDGAHRYRALIENIGSKEVSLKLIEAIPLALAAPSPVLGVALLKPDILKWVLQKGVELGVGEFILFSTQRTIPRLSEQSANKLARFEKIALEAAKQSGMISVPKIHPPLSFDHLVKRFSEFSVVLLFWEEEKESSFQTVFQTIDPSRMLILIGPEGGWTNEEIDQAKKAGAKTAGLGQQILRSETAALAALSLCQYELGNL